MPTERRGEERGFKKACMRNGNLRGGKEGHCVDRGKLWLLLLLGIGKLHEALAKSLGEGTVRPINQSGK